MGELVRSVKSTGTLWQRRSSIGTWMRISRKSQDLSHRPHSIQAQEEMNLPPELYDAFDRILREADRDCLRVRHESPKHNGPFGSRRKRWPKALVSWLAPSPFIAYGSLSYKGRVSGRSP